MWGYFDGENNKNDSIPVESILHRSFFFTVYMLIFESNTKGMFLILSFEYKLFFQSTTVMICQKTVSLFYEKMKLLYLV